MVEEESRKVDATGLLAEVDESALVVIQDSNTCLGLRILTQIIVGRWILLQIHGTLGDAVGDGGRLLNWFNKLSTHLGPRSCVEQAEKGVRRNGSDSRGKAEVARRGRLFSRGVGSSWVGTTGASERNSSLLCLAVCM